MILTAALAVVLVLLLVIDWSQTRFIAKHPELFSELNIVLGKHPSLDAVNAWFALWVFATIVSAWYAEPWFTWAAGGLCALEMAVTVRNYRAGVKLA